MRALRPRSAVLAWTMALGGAGCGGGASAVHVPPDAAAERVEDAGDASVGEAPDAAVDLEADADETADADGGAVDASADVADLTPDASTADADVGREAPVDIAPEAPADVAQEAPTDLAVEKPSATASWTIAPAPACTAAGAGCMDTGAVGGYQVTASGTCATASSLQLWFPGGASPLAAATYAVKPAAGILDVISMPAGMVGVSAEVGGLKYWGRAGSVTVSAAGAGRHVVIPSVTLREESSAATTSLAADVTCP